MDGNTSTSNHTTGGVYPMFQLYPDKLLLAYNTFLSLTICFGVPGNLLVLLVFLKTKISTGTDWFIIFITIFDLISSLFNVPVYLTFTNGAWKHYGTQLLCKLHMYFSQVVVLASAFVISGLAVERYLKVCRPHKKTMSKRSSLATCLGSSLVAAVSSVPAAMMYENIQGRCVSGRLTTAQMVYFFCVFVLFIIVFVVVTFCYTRIILAIRHSTRNVMAHDEFSTSVRPQATPSRSWFSSNKVKPSIESSTHTYQLDPTDKAYQPSKDMSDNETRKPNAKSYAEKNGSAKLSAHDPSVVSANRLSTGPATVWTVTHYPNTAESGNTSMPTSQLDQLASPRVTKDTKKSASSRSTKMRGGSHQSLQTTKIACLVCTIYVITWLIPWTCFIVMQFVRTVDVLRFALFGRMTYLVNTFANPFLYAWLNVKFRQKLKSCLQLKFCKCFSR